MRNRPPITVAVRSRSDATIERSTLMRRSFWYTGGVHRHLVSVADLDAAEIVRILDQAHLKVEALQLHQPSLDDVFLAKTGRTIAD